MNRSIRILRARAGVDGGFAMIFTIFLILVITVTSIAVADLMLSQVGPTGLAKKQVRTVDAADAGLQAALGQLRNATTNGDGDLTKIPCSDRTDNAGITLLVGSPAQDVNVAGDQITGTVESETNAADQASYRTVIAYYATDPTSHETDPTTDWWSTNAISCKANLIAGVPAYAFIQSFGSGTQVGGQSATEGDRTLHAIYQFSTNSSNSTTGGRLAEFINGAQDTMCLDAGATDPAVGSTPTMQSCLALGTPKQDWLYRADLTIEYGGDTTLGGGAGLCLQNVTSSPTTAGTPELKACATSGSGTTYPYASNTQQEQEWPYDDSGHFQAPTSSGTVGQGFCLAPNGSPASGEPAATAGQALTFSSCGGSSADSSSWNPDPQVGAGKSGGNTSGVPGSPTNQYVNYALFGRCLDVSGQSFGNHLIAYPCKQAPDATTLTWNQLWQWQAVGSSGYGIFYTNCSPNAGGCVGGSTSTGEKDCLVNPGTSGQQISGAICPANPTTANTPASEMWYPTGLVNVNGQEDYLESYLLVSELNANADLLDSQCMAADPGQLNSSSDYPEIIITPCDGSKVPTGQGAANYLLLKWNSPPYSPTPGLSDIQEDLGTVSASGSG